MRLRLTNRNFRYIEEKNYPDQENDRLIQESSAIDFDTEDGFDIPGSSYLWISDNFHLNRKQVKEMIDIMQHWLDNKGLPNA